VAVAVGPISMFAAASSRICAQSSIRSGGVRAGVRYPAGRDEDRRRNTVTPKSWPGFRDPIRRNFVDDIQFTFTCATPPLASGIVAYRTHALPAPSAAAPVADT
jgi:hypothetical protein